MRNLLLVLTLFLSSQLAVASSWWFFEPGIGYYQGHYNSSKISGLGFDVKLGFNWNKLYIGADLGYASELNASSVPYDIGMNNTGLVIGYNGGGWRFWYGMVSGATLAYKNGANEYEATGSGSKIGIGAKTGGNSYINLEVNFLKYDELSTNGTPADVNYFMDAALLSFSWLL